MEIKKVVVIGSGTMGSGIAAQLCNADIPVTLLDLKTEISEKAKDRIFKSKPPLLIDKSKINNIQAGNINDNFNVIELHMKDYVRENRETKKNMNSNSQTFKSGRDNIKKNHKLQNKNISRVWLNDEIILIKKINEVALDLYNQIKKDIYKTNNYKDENVETEKSYNNNALNYFLNYKPQLNDSSSYMLDYNSNNYQNNNNDDLKKIRYDKK